MYAEYYKLTEEPFPVTPDPTYLFLSNSHKEALASIVYGIENRRGFVAIVGEVGTGKTTILQAYLDTVDKESTSVIYVYDPQVTFEELIVFVAAELGITIREGASRSAIVTEIHFALVRAFRSGRTVILVIDEAQNIPVTTLESLRLLSNIETKRSKLLQIVMAGQPELEQLLARQELRQLHQRIAVKSTIVPLTTEESRDYINDRIEAVALERRQIFDERALNRIIKFAGGIPRLINIACDAVLMNGYGHGAWIITDQVAKEALATLEQPAARPLLPYWKIASGLAAAALVALVTLRLTTLSQTPTAQSVSQAPVAQPAAEREQHVFVDPVVTKSQRDTDTMVAIEQKPIAAPAAIDTPDEATISGRKANESDAVVSREVKSAPVSESVLAAVPDSVLPVAAPLESDAVFRVKWDPENLPDAGFPMQRLIRRGEMISQICLDIYGFAGPELYDLLRKRNSGLSDIHDISPGQTIVLPRLTAELQSLREQYIKRKLRRRARRMADAS